MIWRLPTANDIGPFWDPGMAYVPPECEPAPCEPCLDYEVKTFRWPGSRLVAPRQVTTITTDRRWRAIDVYAVLPRGYFATAGRYLRVFVYAINEGTGLRALVGSGLVGGEVVAAGGSSPSFRVASVLGAQAQRFQVDVSLAGAAGAARDAWVVTAIASDESAGGPGDDVNTTVVAGAAALPGSLGTAVVLPAGVALPTWQLRIGRVTATNTTALQRWLQFHDQPDPAACAAVRPIFSLGIPAGGTIVIERELAAYRFSRLGLVAFPSTSGSVGAGAGADDVVYTAALG